MSEEDAFLRKLLEQPGNDLTRVVYADWLDEQGTPDAVAKAEFLRLLAEPDAEHPERAKELAGQLDPQWLAVVAKLPIENCTEPREAEVRTNALGAEFVFECPKRWEELTPTEEGHDVRFCGACRKTVHYCHDRDDLRANANAGNCVAVQLGVPRRSGDLEPEVFMTMGIIGPEESAADAAERIRQHIRDEAGARRRKRKK